MAKAAATLLKVAGILLALTATAIAQDYSTKPVRLIVPFAPGGSVDVIARSIAMQLGERLGRRCWWTTGRAPAASLQPSLR